MKKFFVLLFALISSLSFASKWVEDAFNAVEIKSAEEIRHLMDTDYSFPKYKYGEAKQNVLMYAIECNRDIDVIKVLLKGGVSPSATDKNGKTALMYACEQASDVDVVKAVLEYDTTFKFSRKNRILKKDKAGNNCFDYARMNYDSEAILEYLGTYAVDPKANQTIPEEEVLPEEETAALDEPVEEIPEVAEVLPEEGLAVIGAALVAGVEAPEEDTAELEEALEVEQTLETEIAEIEELPEEPEKSPYNQEIFALEKSVGPGIHGESIYLYDYADAAAAGVIPLALINKENLKYNEISDPDSTDAKGVTRLMKAAKAGNKDLIRDLIMSGADLEKKDMEGWTALMYASRYQNDASVAKLLMGFGANAASKNNYGINSLKLASAFSKSPDVVETLLNPFMETSEEVREAFVYGIKNSNSAEVLSPFLKKKLQLNVPFDGKTYLMYAAENNKKTDIIDMLLKSGASKETREDISGKTAFDYAKDNKKIKHDSVYWSLNTR